MIRVFVFLLAFGLNLAHAETTPASTGYKVDETRWFPTVREACDYGNTIGNPYPGVSAADFNSMSADGRTCKYGKAGVCTDCYPLTPVQGLYCPSGVLNGNVCDTAQPCPTYPPSTPDSLPVTQPSNCQCPAGTQWYAGNGCRKTCDSSQPTGGVANAGFGIAIADGASEACFQGCLVQHQSGSYDQYKGYKVATATWSKWACKGTGLGSAPTPDGNPEPDAQTQDPAKKKDPPCAAGEGVITSSSGGVKCLPEGTPNTSRPTVDEKKKTETFPDNSTKTTTEVTTRDPNTGASSVSVTTTSTGGLSGPAGTSTTQGGTNGNLGGGSGDNSGNEPGQCAKEPDSPMCKKGTVKDKGQFDSAQGAKLQEAKDQLTAKFNEIKTAASSAFSSSTSSGSGTLPCPAPITVLGKPVSLCVSDYSNQLSVIGAIIVFAAGIIAILLVVTA